MHVHGTVRHGRPPKCLPTVEWIHELWYVQAGTRLGEKKQSSFPTHTAEGGPAAMRTVLNRKKTGSLIPWRICVKF